MMEYVIFLEQECCTLQHPIVDYLSNLLWRLDTWPKIRTVTLVAVERCWWCRVKSPLWKKKQHVTKRILLHNKALVVSNPVDEYNNNSVLWRMIFVSHYLYFNFFKLAVKYCLNARHTLFLHLQQLKSRINQSTSVPAKTVYIEGHMTSFACNLIWNYPNVWQVVLVFFQFGSKVSFKCNIILLWFQ